MSAADEYGRKVVDEAIGLANRDPFRPSTMQSILTDAAWLATDYISPELAVEVLAGWKAAADRVAEGGEPR